VRWQDGSVQLAEIIEKKEVVRERKREKLDQGTEIQREGSKEKDEESLQAPEPSPSADGPLGSLSQEEDKEMEYYVHYVDFNRRLDEWIGSDRIVPEEEATKKGVDGDREEERERDSNAHEEIQPERKITRKMKRQHDEMNHVQRVSIFSFNFPPGIA